ncbi:MAG: Rieske (2Fe-2S) protein [Ignavibacteria bacterium]|nr:Rieske (2Fe-2S) protein [Ignavibacteria bacterium]
MIDTYQHVERESILYLQICKSIDVFEGKGKNFFFEEELQIAVFRVKGLLYALSNICLHQHASVLCDGFIEDLTVRCPLHGWVYSLASGQTIGSPSNLKTYKIWEEQGLVYLEKPTLHVPKWMNSL